MYVTLEPCQMCSGAIVQARIPRVVIGTMNAKAGCAGSVINILQMEGFNHRVDITKGVLMEECRDMMQAFLSSSGLKRQKKSRLTVRRKRRKNRYEKDYSQSIRFYRSHTSYAGALLVLCYVGSYKGPIGTGKESFRAVRA